MIKNCIIHNIEYNYVCPECIKPFLINTEFSNLQEIRDYQKRNAKKLKLRDLKSEVNLIGIIKIKLLENFAHSGLQLYDLKEKEVIDTIFTSSKPNFSEYFPSFLFLNQTKIYLDLINDLKASVDCYIINSSGRIHPYLYGSACDLGLKIKTPVIGYTKKLLFGELRENKQNSEILEIFYQNTLIGYGIPKPNSKKFIYISVGNNISLQSALDIFLKLDFKIFSNLSNELNNYIKNK
jgi:deoxyinosine 3'endonuclease (endonuclease V)